MVGCSSGWWVTASREQYWPVGPCHRSSIAAACASMSGSSTPRSAPSDRSARLAAAKNALNPTSSISTDPVRGMRRRSKS